MANTGSGAGKKPNKMAAVRQAVDRLGLEAKPAAILADIKRRHGIKMSPQMVSNYKSHISRKMAGQSTLARSRASRQGSNLSMDDIKAVKTLVARLGVDRVRQLTKLVTE